MEDWTKEIEINDLDEKNKEIAEVIGIENLLKLSKTYGGESLYINKYEEVIKNRRDKNIKNEYNRYNVKKLASKYNLTEKRIKQIVQDLGMENQISLFDRT